MTRHTFTFGAGTSLILALAMSCSDEESGNGGNGDGGTGGGSVVTAGGNGSGSGGTAATGASAALVDLNGDGIPDELSAAATVISEEQIGQMSSASCAGWDAEPEPMGATLMMVVDASSSMNDAPPEGGNQSKWEVTRDALIEAVNMLGDTTQLGMLAYPNKVVDGTSGDASMCVAVDQLVPIGPLATERDAVITALNAVQTNQCTPTHDAYNVALADFAARTTIGQKYILLMTDGQPTLYQGCDPGSCGADLDGGEQPVIDAIAAARANNNIKTFILGCPGSEVHSVTGLDNRWWLSQAAEVGGTAKIDCSHSAEPYCHFDMTTGQNFSDELRNALAAIVGQVVSCQYILPEPPEGETLDLDKINMVLRPTDTPPLLITRSQDPGCTQGWYLDPETQDVRLCSETCEIIQADARAEAQLFFGCGSVEIIR